MFRSLRLILCVFLTSAFNSAWADYCFENTNTSGVMARFICFKEINILNFKTPKQKLHFRTSEIDQSYDILKLIPSAAGLVLTAKGDYINYAKDCGLTFLSQYDFKAKFTSQGVYVHDMNNALIIKYKYTPNNCAQAAVSGIEHFRAQK